MARTAFITHEDCVKHEMTPGHPEQPARIGAVLNEFVTQGLFQMLQRFEAVEATRQHLLLAHPESHVNHVYESAPAASDGTDQSLVPLDPDTALNQYSLRAALLAAGAGVQAVDLVMGSEFDNAFCCVRPPGHHAEKTQAMGFCFFGSIAIAALHALEQPGINRVAIIDFDVHHGNGTEDLIGDHDNIFFCSSFQHPFYPGKFGANVPGRKINIPLDAGSGGAEFKARMESECMPALEAFKPDMILISAGFDAHKDDPLGGLNWTEDDFAWITRELLGVAERHCKGRVVSMLEGGYNLDALGTSAAVHVKTLIA